MVRIRFLQAATCIDDRDDFVNKIQRPRAYVELVASDDGKRIGFPQESNVSGYSFFVSDFFVLPGQDVCENNPVLRREGLLLFADLIAKVFRKGKPVVQVGQAAIPMYVVKKEI